MCPSEQIGSSIFPDLKPLLQNWLSYTTVNFGGESFVPEFCSWNMLIFNMVGKCIYKNEFWFSFEQFQNSVVPGWNNLRWDTDILSITVSLCQFPSEAVVMMMLWYERATNISLSIVLNITFPRIYCHRIYFKQSLILFLISFHFQDYPSANISTI